MISEQEVVKCYVQEQTKIQQVNQRNQAEAAVQSDHTIQYLSILEVQVPKTQYTRSQLELLRHQKILFFRGLFFKDVSIEIIHRSQGQRIVTLSAKIGLCKLNITIFNQFIQSPSHKFRCLMHRQERVYLAQLQNQTEVIKCFKIDFNDNPSLRFANILRQYCLLKIADALNVGPTLSYSLGFDLVVYKDCVQFIMERCIQLEFCADKFDDSQALSLKKGLYLLHGLHIIHLDIKPANILYSEIKKKFVFIDFGMSQVIDQIVGYKTKSTFRGTVNYSSPQMRKLYFSKINEQGFVDLYFNDAFGLKLVLESMSNPSKQNQIQSNPLMLN